MAKSTWAQEVNCGNLSVNATIENNGCQGLNSGSITLFVSGGSEPYNYKWTHGASGKNLTELTSGTYSVLVEDGKGCKVEKNFVVADQGNFEILADLKEPTSPSSMDGEVSIRFSGGAAPFTVFISDYTNPSNVRRYQQNSKVIKNLGKGRYVIDVQDGSGCIASMSFMLKNSLISR